jgi:hypothetical protein
VIPVGWDSVAAWTREVSKRMPDMRGKHKITKNLYVDLIIDFNYEWCSSVSKRGIMIKL